MASLNPYPKAKSQPCFVMRFTDPLTHRQQTKYLHLPEKDAKKIFELKQSELTRIKYGLETSSTAKLVGKLKELYLDFLSHNRQYTTYNRNRIAITNFINVVGDVSVVKPFHIEQFKMSNRHRSDIGVNTDLRCVRAMLNWAQKMEHISYVPYFPFYSETKKEIRLLSNADIKIILTCEEIDKETLKLIEIYLLTGARARELLQSSFTWDQYNKQNKFLLLGKANKQHRVELSGRAIKIFESWGDRSAPIPYTYTYIKKRMTKASKLCGIKFTTHDLRRASGALLLRSGASIYEVSKFLGHSSVKVTETWYIGLLKDDYVALSALVEKAVAQLILV